ncbi:hypothetical protein NLI96_g10417 [Meripilus lineatus]|uniref:Uncharacterized protein n=1 Tax=Meripilus lineatus TaxID=2056292 RepID=A0AAD5UVG5_9APHY|nr:hypothetical protein NLI96_g10417 [Physisporinus lineatus]
MAPLGRVSNPHRGTLADSVRPTNGQHTTVQLGDIAFPSHLIPTQPPSVVIFRKNEIECRFAPGALRVSSTPYPVRNAQATRRSDASSIRVFPETRSSYPPSFRGSVRSTSPHSANVNNSSVRSPTVTKAFVNEPSSGSEDTADPVVPDCQPKSKNSQSRDGTISTNERDRSGTLSLQPEPSLLERVTNPSSQVHDTEGILIPSDVDEKSHKTSSRSHSSTPSRHKHDRKHGSLAGSRRGEDDQGSSRTSKPGSPRSVVSSSRSISGGSSYNLDARSQAPSSSESLAQSLSPTMRATGTRSSGTSKGSSIR